MYNSAQFAEIKGKVECINGTAISGKDVFQCNNVSGAQGRVCTPVTDPVTRSIFFISCLTLSSVAQGVSALPPGVGLLNVSPGD